ncbi:uncharacterized protein CLUP02_08630 [Colletotrichum lupini]|uniref:Uncharacterized protein n=1 Tax=Colletotrichum lupini TaxID=145971 RepID=A0A9Q8WHN0_9PEZI|nr:uncharacterized protein CLUP02_08630 [Colletotrichum lupini]UQC83137.1 hypothetical protein CLUP02_08630 [Colletotrichum lupini]
MEAGNWPGRHGTRTTGSRVRLLGCCLLAWMDCSSLRFLSLLRLALLPFRPFPLFSSVQLRLSPFLSPPFRFYLFRASLSVPFSLRLISSGAACPEKLVRNVELDPLHISEPSSLLGGRESEEKARYKGNYRQYLFWSGQVPPIRTLAYPCAIAQSESGIFSESSPRASQTRPGRLNGRSTGQFIYCYAACILHKLTARTAAPRHTEGGDSRYLTFAYLPTPVCPGTQLHSALCTLHSPPFTAGLWTTLSSNTATAPPGPFSQNNSCPLPTTPFQFCYSLARTTHLAQVPTNTTTTQPRTDIDDNDDDVTLNTHGRSFSLSQFIQQQPALFRLSQSITPSWNTTQHIVSLPRLGPTLRPDVAILEDHSG